MSVGYVRPVLMSESDGQRRHKEARARRNETRSDFLPDKAWKKKKKKKREQGPRGVRRTQKKRGDVGGQLPSKSTRQVSLEILLSLLLVCRCSAWLYLATAVMMLVVWPDPTSQTVSSYIVN